MVLLARDVATGVDAAGATDDDAVVLRVNLDLLACQAGQLRGQHEVACGLVEIDRRRPAGRVRADEMTELFVEREEVAQRIPARERHVFHPRTTTYNAELGQQAEP